MAEQARLESAYLRKGIVGSNPTLSAFPTRLSAGHGPNIEGRIRPLLFESG